MDDNLYENLLEEYVQERYYDCSAKNFSKDFRSFIFQTINDSFVVSQVNFFKKFHLEGEKENFEETFNMLRKSLIEKVEKYYDENANSRIKEFFAIPQIALKKFISDSHLDVNEEIRQLEKEIEELETDYHREKMFHTLCKVQTSQINLIMEPVAKSIEQNDINIKEEISKAEHISNLLMQDIDNLLSTKIQSVPE